MRVHACVSAGRPRHNRRTRLLSHLPGPACTWACTWVHPSALLLRPVLAEPGTTLPVWSCKAACMHARLHGCTGMPPTRSTTCCRPWPQRHICRHALPTPAVLLTDDHFLPFLLQGPYLAITNQTADNLMYAFALFFGGLVRFSPRVALMLPAWFRSWVSNGAANSCVVIAACASSSAVHPSYSSTHPQAPPLPLQLATPHPSRRLMSSFSFLVLQGQMLAGWMEFQRKNTWACVTWLCYSGESLFFVPPPAPLLCTSPLPSWLALLATALQLTCTCTCVHHRRSSPLPCIPVSSCRLLDGLRHLRPAQCVRRPG